MRDRTELLTAAGVVAALAVVAPVAPAAAQTGGTGPLSIHGFMTQAYARSWDAPLIGIPVDGTLDYRAVALQVGYHVADNNRLVLQFSHRRLGESLLEGTENQVRLDWGFYERDFGEGSVRVGKVPMPRGFYNEIRHVGSALPFYRAPFQLYFESAETLDGAVATYRFKPEGRWPVEGTVFGGAFDFDYVAHQPAGAAVESIEARSVHGLQLWLEPPLRGTRVGASAMRYRQKLPGDANESFYSQWMVSAERVSELVTVRGEFQQSTSESYGYKVYYGHAGIKLLARLTAHMQAEFAELSVDSPFGAFDVDFGRDLAVGLNLSLVPNAALKIEGHRYRGFGVDQFNPMTGPPANASYVITSISFGF